MADSLNCLSGNLAKKALDDGDPHGDKKLLQSSFKANNGPEFYTESVTLSILANCLMSLGLWIISTFAVSSGL